VNLAERRGLSGYLVDRGCFEVAFGVKDLGSRFDGVFAGLVFTRGYGSCRLARCFSGLAGYAASAAAAAATSTPAAAPVGAGRAFTYLSGFCRSRGWCRNWSFEAARSFNVFGCSSAVGTAIAVAASTPVAAPAVAVSPAFRGTVGAGLLRAL
jgi:hypothetical protein